MPDDEFAGLRQSINSIFTPATPLQSRELFAGRITQIADVIHGINEPGRHVILHGERGVGKTSLANIIGEILEASTETSGIVTTKVTAVSGDTYGILWRKILHRLVIPAPKTGVGIGAQDKIQKLSGMDLVSDQTSPDEMTTVLQRLGLRCTFIIDEYDRVTDHRTRTAVADTLKVVSDNVPSVTIVLVGVSKTIEDLIGHHPSVQRCLKQVKMPRMDEEEMDEILDSRLKRLGMTIMGESKRRIRSFAAGFPSYVHLLAKHAALHAVERKDKNITPPDFDASVEEALEEASEGIRLGYQRATMTSRRTTLYEPILSACAEVEKDIHGTFRPVDLVPILRRILGPSIGETSVYPPLAVLCTDKRGPILERVGPRYRFIDPLMEAYVRLRVYQRSK